MRFARCWAIAAVLALWLAAVTWAVPPTSAIRTAPRHHESGDVRWSDWMVSTTLDTCDPRLLRTEPPRPDQLRYNCVSHVMEMRSESDKPIQCQMLFELTEPAFGSARRMGRKEIIYPGRVGSTHELLAPATSSPASFTSTCELLPEETPPPPETPPGCTMKFEGKYLDDYYPRSAIRLKQEGVAEIDFTVDQSLKRLLDYTLVRSSGIESIDRHSLMVLKGARPVASCHGQRFRGEIRFKLEGESPRVMVRWIPGASTGGG
jgi:TonB family protein